MKRHTNNLDIKKLTQDEITVVKFLKKKDYVSSNEISNVIDLDEIKVLRTFQWLENKGFVDVIEKEVTHYKRTKLGEIIANKGLPEKKFLQLILKQDLNLKELKNMFEPQEFNVSVGILKKNKLINIISGKVKITNLGREKLNQTFEIENLILNKELSENQINERDVKELLMRGFFEKNKRKVLSAKLVNEAREIDFENLNLKENLTSKMILNASYNRFNFRSYDVTAKVPKMFSGRRHFINEAREYIRQVWIDLGFSEMSGNLIQTSFWNFDALFVPQDHPARDMQDTFFVKKPEKGKLPDSKLVSRVRRTHNDGWTTKSTGYKTSWSRAQAAKYVLRTHTTCLSAKIIANLKATDLPCKFFSVGLCFRNETLDWKHLFEFDQVEGIVIDKKVNFIHLKGYLSQFFSKLGYEKIRIRPAYFPYTEMSVEVDVFHPTKNEWIELGGAGIFRPEVVKPLLKKDIRVLAWGLGFGRIITEYFQISDLRDFYKNDLEKLRNIKAWI